MRATLIANPIAGRRRAAAGPADSEGLQAAVEVLERAGWTVDVRFSRAAGDASAIACEAAEQGKEAVIAAGGDGTLNEAAQALAGTDVALGYLPFGTVNVWARELGMPLDPAGAAGAVASGRMESVDLGTVNGRYFLLMAGAGFDGEVVRRARSLERYKQRFGILPYAAATLLTMARYPGADVELRYDGVIRRVQALMLVVGNTRLYGGRYHLTPNAVANDGWLDLCIVKGGGPIDLLRQAAPIILTGTVARADIELQRVRELTMQSDNPVPIQVDGELATTTPANFSITPRSLKVIVPRDFRSELIR